MRFFSIRFEIRHLVTRDTTNSLSDGVVVGGGGEVVCFWKLMDGRLAWRIDGFPRDPTAQCPPPLPQSNVTDTSFSLSDTAVPPKWIPLFKTSPSPPTGRSNGTDTSLQGVPSLMTNCFPARAVVTPLTDRVNRRAAASFAVCMSFLIHLATSYIICPSSRENIGFKACILYRIHRWSSWPW